MGLKRIVFFLFLFAFAEVNAAHLVGGEISYTCLGGNDYDVKLRIYRDCGGTGAQFDASVSIAIYDINGFLVQNLIVPKGPTVSISANPTNDPCITVPTGLCTEYAEYQVQVNLPPTAGGYVISHQRCCRNGTISNVVNSGDWGNTYTVAIPDMDTSCNSSPQILNVAPTVLCNGANLNQPVQVFEADGDSLYFEFCDILHGGGKVGGTGCGAVVPNPSCPPPFTNVPFAAPYTAQNPMPGSIPIQIDGQTGLITGKPSTLGQYVVGICVSEYRDSVLLSTVRLDYQFNVATCGQPIAEMVTPSSNPTMLCNGLKVDFVSLSSGANAYQWTFGNPVLGTSTDPNPSFVFPVQGSYPVELIVNPGQACTDTVMYFFSVRDSVKVEMNYTGIPCFEVQGLEFWPVGSYPATATFSWNFGALANIPTTNLINTPPISWSEPGLHPVSLTISYGACVQTFWDTIAISSLSVDVDAGPDQEILPGQLVQLFASGGTSYRWSSDKPVKISDIFNNQATTITEYDTTTYYVEVIDELGCRGVDSMKVYVVEDPNEQVMNVITPNGDGKNDYLELGHLMEDRRHRISILNRWGNEVYTSSYYDNSWNGRSTAGQELPDGTYYFILQYKDQIVFKGPVTIMRNTHN